MISKHTPGPWTATYLPRRIYRIETKNHGTAICNVEVPAVDYDDCIANVALVAAAPDMLAALLVIERHLSFLESEGCIGDGDVTAIRAAITKAEGRS